mmetsp:Transcript_13329/g.55835  ORF Transcript_13329/g.55835 Transcript_13329/m.55835 type:complete len:284 (+) Transcript_13329:402-1253(+)
MRPRVAERAQLPSQQRRRRTSTYLTDPPQRPMPRPQPRHPRRRRRTPRCSHRPQRRRTPAQRSSGGCRTPRNLCVPPSRRPTHPPAPLPLRQWPLQSLPQRRRRRVRPPCGWRAHQRATQHVLKARSAPASPARRRDRCSRRRRPEQHGARVCPQHGPPRRRPARSSWRWRPRLKAPQRPSCWSVPPKCLRMGHWRPSAWAAHQAWPQTAPRKVSPCLAPRAGRRRAGARWQRERRMKTLGCRSARTPPMRHAERVQPRHCVPSSSRAQSIQVTAPRHVQDSR